MTLQEQTPLWNHASIRVLDIRRSMLQSSESLQGFRLPASAFLLVVKGDARVYVDGAQHSVNQCYVCHAGKGTTIDIVHVAERLDYYFIFYKAALVLPCRKELLELFRDNNPFQMQYGFAPAYPLGILTKAEQMHASWMLNAQLERFHVRALFHQMVYDLLHQLHALEETTITQPDHVTQAIRFMEECYGSSISLQDLADVLHCTTRQLQRLFKAKLGVGPMEYLIQIRMNHAQGMLVNTEVPLKVVAESVGYGDSYYFSRAFKKHFGVSPLYFRQNRRISSSYLSRYSIGSTKFLSYNNDCDNHYQQKGRGVTMMNRSKGSVLAVSIMLSVILLLSACGAGNSAGGNIGGTGSAGSESKAVNSNSNTSVTQAKQQVYPVVIKHMKGELTLEQYPSKIAVLDTKFVDQLVTLGEQPAGSVKAAADKTDFPAYLSSKITDVKLLGTRDEPNLEAILAMEPDLIICTEFQEKVFDSLSKIAPTIMLDFNEDWRDTLVTFGKIVGKPQEAGDILTTYQEKTEKLKGELKAKVGSETVALIRPRNEGIRVHTPGHRAASILYNDLGLSAPQQVLDEKDTAYEVSLEGFPQVGADHYFLVKDDMFKAAVEEVQSTEVWKSVEAVKQNHVYDVDSNVWIAYYGPTAINMIVDRVAEVFLGTP